MEYFVHTFHHFQSNDNAKDTNALRVPCDLNNFNNTRNESNTSIQRVVFAKMKFPNEASVNEVPKFVQNIIIEQFRCVDIEENLKRTGILSIGTPESKRRFAKNGGNVARILHCIKRKDCLSITEMEAVHLICMQLSRYRATSRENFQLPL